MSDCRCAKLWLDRLLAVVLISMTACIPSGAPLLHSSSAMFTDTKLSQTTPLVAVTATVLEAYEDQSEPIGSNQGANRPVGHAIVRLRLESLSLEPITLQVQVAVWDAEQQKKLMIRDMGEITLGGRQILEPGLHLSNREGFQGIQKVKAIVTYQIDRTTYITESLLTDVVVNP